MSSNGTPTQQLADLLLGGRLEEFVRSRRAAHMSWRLIERDLYEATGHRVDVAFVTIRSWYPDPVDDDVGDNVEPLARSA